ncbi:hypothetical protein PTTG_29885, partial [Puccinia triticina 1-1 BBBD Race 1]
LSRQTFFLSPIFNRFSPRIVAPVNRSPSSIATQSSNAAAAASSSNAAGKRVAVSHSSDDDINTVGAPRDETRQPGPRVNLPEYEALPPRPDFAYALDPKNKDHIIKHACHLFPDAKKLVPSGANFCTWLTKMEELADFVLNYRNYYYKDFSRHPVDHIARVIFWIALSDEIKEDINHTDSCYAIMISIQR